MNNDRTRAVNLPRAGIITALWTPTNGRRRPLVRALQSHLAWLRGHGVQGVLALGSTGEFPYLTIDERKAVLEAVAEWATPLPVIANISDIRLHAVIELGRFAHRLGLPAVAIMAPSFYPFAQSDLLEFFSRAAEAIHLPVFLYNFPELAGNRIGPETIAAFADRAPLAGVKQSGAEFSYHEQLIALGREKGFVVFSGADTRLPEVLKLGAVGCIGGLANVVPDLMVEIYESSKAGGDCTVAADRMTQVGRIIDRLAFPLNVAAALESRGLNPGVPKSVISVTSCERYDEVVAELRRRFASWKLAPVVGAFRAAASQAA